MTKQQETEGKRKTREKVDFKVQVKRELAIRRFQQDLIQQAHSDPVTIEKEKEK